MSNPGAPRAAPQSSLECWDNSPHKNHSPTVSASRKNLKKILTKSNQQNSLSTNVCEGPFLLLLSPKDNVSNKCNKKIYYGLAEWLKW
jgi:hypothetical protein